MGIVRRVEVSCSCGERMEFTRLRKMQAIIARIRRLGWVYNKGITWCPKCRERLYGRK